MATKQAVKPDAEQQAATPVEEVPEQKQNTAFEKSELIKSAHLFGTTPEIMAGALSMSQDDKATKQEATDAVKAFLARPVRKEQK